MEVTNPENKHLMEIGRARMTHLQGECSCGRAEEIEIQRRSSAYCQ